MGETPEHLVDRLYSEGCKITTFFRSLTEEQLEQTLYSDGSQWRVRQLMAHFVTTEVALGELIANILAGGGGAPENFDIDAFNERTILPLRDAPLEGLLERFAEGRRASIDLVSCMKETDLSMTGRHPFLGVVSLEEIIKLLYRHNQIHQRDIRRLLHNIPERPE